MLSTFQGWSFSGTLWSAFWAMANIGLKQAPLSNTGVNVMGHMQQNFKKIKVLAILNGLIECFFLFI